MKQEYKDKIAPHALWLSGETTGQRADLTDADLRSADLTDAVLARRALALTPITPTTHTP